MCWERCASKGWGKGCWDGRGQMDKGVPAQACDPDTPLSFSPHSAVLSGHPALYMWSLNMRVLLLLFNIYYFILVRC